MILTHTISVVELIWMIGCLPGLFYNGRILRRAAGDLAVLRVRRINSIREFSAITTITLFAYLTVVQALFVMIGGIALITPQADKITTTGYTITVVFLIVSLMSGMIGWLIDKRRRSLIRIIDALENEDDLVKLKEVIHGSRS